MIKIKKGFVTGVILCMILLGGCKKAEETKIDSITPDADSAPVEEIPQIVSFDKGSEEAKEEEVSKFIIEQKDADMLLTEALSGTDCKAVYSDTAEIDEKGYYTYTVIDPNGEDMKKGLAVDGFSGDIFIYDPAEKKVSDFEQFEYYDRSSLKSRNIDWDGRFVLDNYSVELLPADEGSFEFTIYKKDKKILSGLAVTEDDTAEWESEEDGSISFRMVDENTLQMVGTGKAKISGQYIKE